MLFTITSNVVPDTSSNTITVGSPCNLNIEIKDARPTDVNNTDVIASDISIEYCHLFYSIQVSASSWMVYGRTSGIVMMPKIPGGSVSVSVLVIPLISGNVPMPAIKLSHYNSQSIQYLNQKVVNTDTPENSSNVDQPTDHLSHTLQPNLNSSSTMTSNASFTSIHELVMASSSDGKDSLDVKDHKSKGTGRKLVNQISLGSSQDFDYYPLSDHKTIMVDANSPRESIEPEAVSQLKTSVSFSGFTHAEKQHQKANIPELVKDSIVRPFRPGEVCNYSKAAQVRVLPSNAADFPCYALSVVNTTPIES